MTGKQTETVKERAAHVEGECEMQMSRFKESGTMRHYLAAFEGWCRNGSDCDAHAGDGHGCVEVHPGPLRS